MINIVPTTVEHVAYIIETLRPEDRKEIEAIGLDVDKALFYTHRNAIWSRTGLVNDKPAAIWGVAGELLSSVGVPFLTTGIEVENISPLKFSRIYKKEVEDMKKLFSSLENYVESSYTGAVRMLKIAGFSLDEPIKVGSGNYQKFHMKADSYV